MEITKQDGRLQLAVDSDAFIVKGLLGVVLAALAVLFYVITVAKLGPNLFNRPM